MTGEVDELRLSDPKERLEKHLEECMEEWLTVAEAANRLGIAARQARRYADKLKDKDKDTRKDAQGQSLLYVRFSSVEIMRQESLERLQRLGQSKGHSEGQGQGHSQGRARTVPPLGSGEEAEQEAEPHDQNGPSLPQNAEGTLPAVIYQKIISDKDAEIEYLRLALRMAQENLAREQMLRSLPSPQAPVLEASPEASNERPGDTQSRESADLGTPSPPDPIAGHFGAVQDYALVSREAETIGIVAEGEPSRSWAWITSLFRRKG